MDMSFAFNQRMTPAGVAVSMADIMAAGAVWQPAAPVRARLPIPRRVKDEGLDSVGTLARVIVSGDCGSVESSRLGGSFSPRVADCLMVGK